MYVSDRNSTRHLITSIRTNDGSVIVEKRWRTIINDNESETLDCRIPHSWHRIHQELQVCCELKRVQVFQKQLWLWLQVQTKLQPAGLKTEADTEAPAVPLTATRGATSQPGPMRVHVKMFSYPFLTTFIWLTAKNYISQWSSALGRLCGEFLMHNECLSVWLMD